MKNLKGYLTLTRAGIIESLQFRASTLVVIAGNLIYLIVIYNLWHSIYASVDSDVVNGMTFTDTMLYLVLANALFNFMEGFLVWEMGRSIQSGAIVLDILKPMPFEMYKFFSFAGNWVCKFFTTFIPTLIVVEIITGGAIHLGLNLIWFLISVVMGNIINFAIDFFVGTICLYSQSIWGINIMKEVLVLFLSGATIPLAFFPETLRKIVGFLPFQAIYNTPLTLLTDNSLSVTQSLQMIGFQLMWVVITLFLSKFFWKKSLKIITVNGG